jgi:peptide/nickel transport system permease protein|tara:strand:+ start:2253 stop:3248 length:996 start_codon:yes stop_codon:yes gene_type:complete
MKSYLLQRFGYMVFLLWMTTIVTFIVIELPPGDYVSTLVSRLEGTGHTISEETRQQIQRQFGLDQPPHIRYVKWVGQIMKGNLGYSFDWKRPVKELIGQRLALTVTIALLSTIITYLIAVPIGIYSATHQYSIGDYFFTTWGFLGLAIPNFMLALVLLFVGLKYFGVNLTGLFSKELLDAPWSSAKLLDLLKHLPIPVLVVATGGSAGLIRILRATLLDELEKQYVITARSKGLGNITLLFKYPVRICLNPLVSNLAWLFPSLISGGAITAIVLGLPTAGPMMLRALITQDTYLAGSILLFLTMLTLIGTLISDILLVMVDPRIRMERSST